MGATRPEEDASSPPARLKDVAPPEEDASGGPARLEAVDAAPPEEDASGGPARLEMAMDTATPEEDASGAPARLEAGIWAGLFGFGRHARLRGLASGRRIRFVSLRFRQNDS